MSSNNSSTHTSSAGVKKAEYDFVPSAALGVIIVVLIMIVIAAVIFIWSVLNKATTDALLKEQGTIRTTIINTEGQVLQVQSYLKEQKALVKQGGVDKKTGAKVQPIASAMQELLKHPGYIEKLPDAHPPAPQRRAAPTPRRVAPRRAAPTPRRAAPIKRRGSAPMLRRTKPAPAPTLRRAATAPAPTLRRAATAPAPRREQPKPGPTTAPANR